MNNRPADIPCRAQNEVPATQLARAASKFRLILSGVNCNKYRTFPEAMLSRLPVTNGDVELELGRRHLSEPDVACRNGVAVHSVISASQVDVIRAKLHPRGAALRGEIKTTQEDRQ